MCERSQFKRSKWHVVRKPTTMVTRPCCLEKLEEIILGLQIQETPQTKEEVALEGSLLLIPRILYDTLVQVSLLLSIPSVVHCPRSQKMLLEGKY